MFTLIRCRLDKSHLVVSLRLTDTFIASVQPGAVLSHFVSFQMRVFLGHRCFNTSSSLADELYPQNIQTIAVGQTEYTAKSAHCEFPKWFPLKRGI